MAHFPLFHPNVAQKSALSRLLTLVVVFVPFLATIFAIVNLWQRDVTPIDLVLLAVFYLLSALGISIGFHRFATHRSFRSHPAAEILLLALGSMAVEGGVIRWTADHWKHHKFADQPGDPHSPVEGLLHAHVVWFFGTNRGVPAIDAKHLLRDPIARLMSQTFLLWVALGLAVPFLVDGWRGLLWGGLVRIFLIHHVTWSVNSICHQFGRRDFQTTDHSGNQWVVGILGLGEGWNNNHHAFPESASFGLSRWQIDVSSYVIGGLEKIGAISDVRRVSRERIQAKRAALARDSIPDYRRLNSS